MTAGLNLFANNATTTLAGAISSGATSVNLAAGTGAKFPNPAAGQYFQLTLVDQATGLLNEVVSCTARSGDTLTIVRAQEGTSALSWLAGDLVSLYWTAGSASSLVQSAQLQIQPGNYAADTGSVNALAVTLSQPPASLAAIIGAPIRVKIANTNTGVATLNVNNLGATAIWTSAGAAISAGQLVAGGVAEFVYDGTNFQLISWSGLSSSGVGVGSYTFSNITVGATGLVTAASNGVLTSGMVTTALGFTPTRQGSYAGGTGNTISFGWSSPFVTCAIDNNPNAVGALASTTWVGANFATNSWVSTYYLPITNPSVNGTLTASAAVNSSGTMYAATGISSGGPITAGGSVNATGNVIANGGRLRAAYGALGSGDPNAAALLLDFYSTFGNPGWTRLPNGMILQWGQVSSGLGSFVAFPVTFPSYAASVVVCEGAAGASNWGVGSPTLHAVSNAAANGFTHWGLTWVPGGWSGATLSTNYIAIGW